MQAEKVALAGTISSEERGNRNKDLAKSKQGDRKVIKDLTRRMLLLGVSTLLIMLVGCNAPSSQQSNPPVTTTPLTQPPSPTSTASPASSSDWTMYHRDKTRTGYLANMPDPHTLTRTWSTQLDGAVYAEPLVVGGHVIVATEGDSLYSLDAPTGRIEWHTTIGKPVPLSTLPCGNIDPLGITGTPVYDPATGLVFAVAEVSGPAHILVGVDARTGEQKVRRSVDLPGMESQVHQQRGALALYKGMVYIAYGGLFGDCGNYLGRVVASRTDGTGSLLSFKVPTQREGGIWAPPGPVIDDAGHIYVSVGNGSETQGDWDHSDSVLRLSSTLNLEDGFAPNQWQADNSSDADLGSTGPVLLPDGFIFIAGKAGIGYLLHADALGGVGGEVLSKDVCGAYGGAASVGSVLFLPCNEGLQQVRVGPGATFTLGWRAAQVPGSPVVGGQTVYSLDRGGTLYALDSGSGKARATVSVGVEVSRFATPTLWENYVFVGTLTGVVGVMAG
jgi:outer membrane protein assembly factor BamB